MTEMTTTTPADTTPPSEDDARDDLLASFIAFAKNADKAEDLIAGRPIEERMAGVDVSQPVVAVWGVSAGVMAAWLATLDPSQIVVVPHGDEHDAHDAVTALKRVGLEPRFNEREKLVFTDKARSWHGWEIIVPGNESRIIVMGLTRAVISDDPGGVPRHDAELVGELGPDRIVVAATAGSTLADREQYRSALR